MTLYLPVCTGANRIIFKVDLKLKVKSFPLEKKRNLNKGLLSKQQYKNYLLFTESPDVLIQTRSQLVDVKSVDILQKTKKMNYSLVFNTMSDSKCHDPVVSCALSDICFNSHLIEDFPDLLLDFLSLSLSFSRY